MILGIPAVDGVEATEFVAAEAPVDAPTTAVTREESWLADAVAVALAPVAVGVGLAPLALALALALAPVAVADAPVVLATAPLGRIVTGMKVISLCWSSVVMMESLATDTPLTLHLVWIFKLRGESAYFCVATHEADVVPPNLQPRETVLLIERSVLTRRDVDRTLTYTGSNSMV